MRTMTRSKPISLGGYDDFGGYEGEFHPAWGAAIGGGVGAGTAVAVRQFTDPTSDWHRASEWIGLASGLLASGLLFIWPSTRTAGWTGLAASLAGGLPRAVEAQFLGTGTATAGVGRVINVSDIGRVGVQRRGALMGMVVPQRRGALAAPVEGVEIVSQRPTMAYGSQYGR